MEQQPARRFVDLPRGSRILLILPIALAYNVPVFIRWGWKGLLVSGVGALSLGASVLGWFHWMKASGRHVPLDEKGNLKVHPVAGVTFLVVSFVLFFVVVEVLRFD